jgi:hypothetical protein
LFQNLKFGIEAMKQAFENSKKLIDLAKEAGFQLHKVKICDLVLVSFLELRTFFKFVENFLELILKIG